MANLNMNVTTTPSLSGEMKEYYYKHLLTYFTPYLRYLQFAQKVPIPKGGGKTVEFRRYSPLPVATTPIVEGVQPDGGQLTMDTLRATINQYGYYVAISDILEYTAIDNNLLQAGKLLGNQAAQTLDTLCRDELMGGTNVIYAPKSDGTEVTSRSALDATCTLTMDLIYDAVTQLKGMNARPVGDSFICIADPYVLKDLMRTDDWVEAHKFGNQEAIYEGEVGRIAQVRFVDSTQSKIWRDDTCPSGLAVHGLIIFGEDAYAATEVEGLGLEHIVHDKSQAGGPLEQFSTVGWKATHVTKRLTEEYMVRIECCSSRSAHLQAN